MAAGLPTLGTVTAQFTKTGTRGLSNCYDPFWEPPKTCKFFKSRRGNGVAGGRAHFPEVGACSQLAVGLPPGVWDEPPSG